MNVKNLDNICLMDRFEKLVRTERKITHLILDCIREIDCRKIYLERAYPSLFEFLTRGFGYSPAAAMRRIDGARLMAEVPELTQKIEEGEINLSQISLLQRAVREVQKNSNEKLDTDSKRELLDKIANADQKETEQILSADLGVDISASPNRTVRSDDMLQLTLTFTKEQMELLEAVKATVSQSLEEQSWASAIVYLADREMKRRFNSRFPARKLSQASGENGNPGSEHCSPISEDRSPATEDRSPISKESASISEDRSPISKESASTSEDHSPNGKITSVVVAPSRQRRRLSNVVRKHVLHKRSSCEFVDNLTGKRCGGQYFLQVDHIRGVCECGTNDIGNLQVLCAFHNRFKYRRENKVRE